MSMSVVFSALLEEHKRFGAMPILGILYMLFSTLFIISFISNFGIIGEANARVFRLTVEDGDHEVFYLDLFKIVYDFVIIAFTSNFCKSFYTINSLEFGLLNGERYGLLFENQKALFISDTILRCFTAFFFIQIEHEISSGADFNKDLFDSIFWLGILTVFLYLSVLAWLYLLKSASKRNPDKCKLDKSWRFWTKVQFWGGLVFGLSLIGLGQKMQLELSLFIPVSASVIGILAGSILTSIVIIELKTFKQKKPSLSEMFNTVTGRNI